MTTPAAITITRGKRFPDGIERVYRLRFGAKGRGEIICEHRARGNQSAHDAAMQGCQDVAGSRYEIVNVIDAFDPLNG